MSDFQIVDVPSVKNSRIRGSRTPLYEAVVAAAGQAVRVSSNGRPQRVERNLLQNGLALFCGRYHHGKFTPHSTLMSDGGIVLCVTPKTAAVMP